MSSSSIIKSIGALKPTLDRVLVQRLKQKTQTASGLYIPDANQQKLNEATVIATGPGYPTESGVVTPVGVKAGDSVLIPAFGGEVIKVGGEEYTLFRDRDILAKIEN
ncbi:hypothetical protein BABINDRAFT_46442 [Babjeviella inositovora NRRL Y-12698]|uniref:10 kDa heat shock protein, mitochondrial n=1 Tax=Babjeviella inositovora NRRL Y-12698 TaxID=984486 RepID=A0A1E3QT60_9ASCO|nr:uncharacterized protein BABINDRAFT_46442 [Babjeviella inositovora NRRL Y-12698]ODQ80895.1 hypothetical protein BABINDRAFT_46442 [Babjeviella inositovora NRRL Y-12698]